MDRFYEFLHNNHKILSTGIKELDEKIGGGLHEKTLTLFMAQANLGKTLVKCAIAANLILQNKNVLYITLEMSEEMIAQRIYQNIFDVDLESLSVLSKDKLFLKVNSIKEKVKNSLYIKEYPTKGATVNTIKNLLKELEIKKKFIPDCVIIDYLGIMAPLYLLKSDNTYTEGKRVSEEVRGLAVEKQVAVLSSLQANRDAFDEVITSMDAMADSIGPAATADIIIALSQTDEMRTSARFMGYILKNRFGLNKQKIPFEVDYMKMKVKGVADDSKPSTKPDANKINEAISITKTEIKKEKTNEKKKIIQFDPDGE
jgi:replicative DNA helicase